MWSVRLCLLFPLQMICSRQICEFHHPLNDHHLVVLKIISPHKQKTKNPWSNNNWKATRWSYLGLSNHWELQLMSTCGDNIYCCIHLLHQALVANEGAAFIRASVLKNENLTHNSGAVRWPWTWFRNQWSISCGFQYINSLNAEEIL